MSRISNILGRMRGWSPGRISYERHLDEMLRKHRGNRDLAFAQAIGADSVAMFEQQGDGHVAVLRHNGLRDGMAVFDLGCGSGRTAQALVRSGWTGSYTGADVIPRFVAYMQEKCPGYQGIVHDNSSIPMADASLDMLFHWSVFTHVTPEECYLYLKDIFRALKPGGTLVFSFLELTEPAHRRVFFNRVGWLAEGRRLPLLDTFLHRDWIVWWAEDLGFAPPTFTDGSDDAAHLPFWQTLVAMTKPA